MLLTGILIGLVGAGATVALSFFLRSKLTGGAAKALSEGEAEILDLHQKFRTETQGNADLVSPLQFAYVKTTMEKAESAVEAQKALLKQIEDRLAIAQKNIEEKEVYHQEMKTAKSEDEAKLKAVLERFQALSSEAISLEQTLAASMKDIDALIAGGSLSDDQRVVFQQLSESLASGGGRLRDLITEYGTVNGRLEALQAQLVDLENEYTRLIEQQLGD